ncbi:MAG: DUF2961 domain-containing protein [Mangrovibacterium sp.]|nr:DUF2961 domain-containing protein [Mangrovibacterium sp.]
MKISTLILIAWLLASCQADKNHIYNLQKLESRAATAENPHAEKGKGGMTAGAIKGSPAIKDFKDGTTEVLLEQRGPGMIRHIWCTSKPMEPSHLRNLILRMYWENHQIPSVEVPLSDFFGVAHGASVPMYSRYLYTQEGRGFNCFFPMPFSKHAKITITNESGTDLDYFFYQVDFTLGDRVTDKDARFHASFRRENPSRYGRDFKIMEAGNARGIYLGCVIGIRPLTDGWWGEGEVKIFMDGDSQYPTICGTGMEDYIGSAWGLSAHSTPVQGAPLVTANFASLYRFHLYDPVYFQSDIKVTVQQMGSTRKENVLPLYGDSLIFSSKNHPRRSPDDGYYLRSDDVCATAYWYQWPLIEKREPLPGKELRSSNLYTPGERRSINAEL